MLHAHLLMYKLKMEELRGEDYGIDKPIDMPT